MAREIKDENVYLSKLLKLIPSEVVAAYLAIVGMIPDTYQNTKLLLTIVSLILLAIIPFYLVKLHNIQRVSQIIFVMCSFIIWVYSLGGPFKEFGIYEAFIGSIILILWTLLIPLFYKRQT